MSVRVMDDDARDQIAEDLTGFARDLHARNEQLRAEQETVTQELTELLLRADDAGLKPGEIAAALNRADELTPEEIEDGQPEFTDRWSPQKISSLLRDARGEAAWAVGRLIHEATEQTDND